MALLWHLCFIYVHNVISDAHIANLRVDHIINEYTDLIWEITAFYWS